ncbi:hypothetical protein SAMN05660493_03317 [Epilithonimonas bovis DSM 19482]|uniref:Phage abortive infection protein n=1 Tax=Epilithonimonas bovis DSM 19482 TaxID=1121284 RepID=A0A1U7PYE5_9FLAO|nr:hypothetical protein [Epilithonimonas bovis]SIT98955.1 hypothetical protein SAMN05660493_03317 [Epilithonimonas bovis DSM 19482]
MKHFKKVTIAVFLIAIIIFALIIFFTSNVVFEEPNRTFRLDFTNKSDIISSYATLISGLLTFLSILFVIYALVSQKNEIVEKENNEKKLIQKDLIENFNVLIYYLKSLLDSLNLLNKTLKEYTTEEFKNPTINNALQIEINKNFTRIVDMDVKTTFKAFKSIYHEKSNENDFVNLYKYIDFYSELYYLVKADYESTKQFKYDKLVEYGFEVLDLYNKKADMIDGYKDEFPGIYKHKPWVEKASKSINDYYKYIEDCEKNKRQNDFDYISDKIFKVYIESALSLRDNIGYGKHNEKEILRLISTLRKKLFYIKGRIYNNAETLENIRVEYLDEKSEHIIKFRNLVEKIEVAVKNYNIA